MRLCAERVNHCRHCYNQSSPPRHHTDFCLQCNCSLMTIIILANEHCRIVEWAWRIGGREKATEKRRERKRGNGNGKDGNYTFTRPFVLQLLPIEKHSEPFGWQTRNTVLYCLQVPACLPGVNFPHTGRSFTCTVLAEQRHHHHQQQEQQQQQQQQR